MSSGKGVRRWRVLAVIALVSVTALAGASAAAADGWTAQQVLSPPVQDGQILGVSCSSPTSCTSVGLFIDRTGDTRPFAARWNGTDWTVDAVPIPADSQYSVLEAVSCPSSQACVAVGSYDDPAPRTLVERWDGSSWSVQSLPDDAGVGSLEGVSCASADDCVAVGSDAPFSAAFYSATPILARWNGSAWQLPALPADATGRFDAVSCPSDGACLVVGTAPSDPYGTHPTAELWNGTRWSSQLPPVPTGDTASVLSAVSCSSATACTAVGMSDSRPLAERWNGVGWTTQPLPTPAGYPEPLTGVACPSAGSCVAVGHFGGDPTNEGSTLAVAWDGTQWTVQPTDDPLADGNANAFTAVSCPQPADCIAVGFSGGGNVVHPLVEIPAAGAWTTHSAPPTEAGTDSRLNSVSCTSADACTSVGYAVSGAFSVPLAERWNGSGWTVESPLPLPAGAHGGELVSVSCAAANACTAIGDAGPLDNVSGDEQIAEHWDGLSWSVETLHAATGPPRAISCPDAKHCMAVGVLESGGEGLVTERWDGSTWTVDPVPVSLSGGLSAVLNGVSCVTSTECVAVGAFGGQPLVVRWDGSSWSTEQTPPAPGPSGESGGELDGVSCSTALSCEAAGDQYDNTHGYQAFVEGEAAGTWTVQGVSTPLKTIESVLSNVSCVSATACSAVGYFEGPARPMMLAERWNGTSWAPEAPGGPLVGGAAGGQLLNGVSCPATSACVAVGYQQGLIDTPAAEGYIPQPHTPVATAPPSISGAAVAGDLLREEHGTWTDPPNEFFYQWESCDSNGANCHDIVGATSSQYDVQTADVGGTIRVLEWANSAGAVSAPAESQATSVVTATVPVTSGAPTASIFTPFQGATYRQGTLVTTQFACADGTNGPGITSCRDQFGQVSGTYLDTSTVGVHTLTVTALSADGLSGATSVTYTVASSLVELAPPSVLGAPTVGSTLVCDPGRWSEPANFFFQWNRNGKPIPFVLSQQYTATESDQGATLSCTVFATGQAEAVGPVTSVPVLISRPPKPTCVSPVGSAAADQLGQVRIGMTRAQVRAAYAIAPQRLGTEVDVFCVGPSAIRVGYGSPQPKSGGRIHRDRQRDPVVWASTRSSIYDVAGVRIGTTRRAAMRLLPRAHALTIRRERWYFARTRDAVAAIRFAHGAVTEVAVASSLVASTRRGQIALVRRYAT